MVFTFERIRYKIVLNSDIYMLAQSKQNMLSCKASIFFKKDKGQDEK